MNEASFEIYVGKGSVELKASGKLTGNENIFRLHLLKLLMQGKSKSFKLNLRQASSIDTTCIQLVYIFKRQLEAVNATLVIEMSEDPDLKIFPMKKPSASAPGSRIARAVR